MLPFCFGESENFFERSGRIVPNMAAIMPYTKMPRIAAVNNMFTRCYQIAFSPAEKLGGKFGAARISLPQPDRRRAAGHGPQLPGSAAHPAPSRAIDAHRAAAAPL